MASRSPSSTAWPPPEQLTELERRFDVFLGAIAEATGVTGDPAPIAARIRARTERAFVGMAPSAADAERTAAVAEGKAERAAAAKAAKAKAADAARATRRKRRPARPPTAEPAPPPSPAVEPGLGRRDRATLLAWLTLSQTGVLAPRGKPASTSLAWYDELRMPGALVAGLHDVGFDEGEAWAITDRVRVLLALPRPSTIGAPARTAPGRLLDAWLASEPVRVAIGLNTWQGVEYLDRDQFGDLLGWAVRLETIESEAPVTSSCIVGRGRSHVGRRRRRRLPGGSDACGARGIAGRQAAGRQEGSEADGRDLTRAAA